MKFALVRLLAVVVISLAPFNARARRGDLYVTDNSSIRVFEPNGTEHVFAAGLLRPRGLAFDGFGNLFVATLDTDIRGDGRGQILKFAPDGSMTVFASGAGLKSPEGLAFDQVGNLYATSVYFGSSILHSPLSNAGEGRVLIISPDGDKRVLNLDPTTFHQNFGVTVDAQNNLLVADNLQNGIYKFAPDRRTSSFISLEDPIGLVFDSAGNLYASQALGGIVRIAPDGTQTLIVSGLGELRGLAFDFDSNLFAASPFFAPDGDGHDVIYKITPNGAVSIFAAGLDTPQFIAVEP
ncbi:MAG TPA: hypothetical protein VLE19_12605 [Pyrinomonadaceae bacterium]|nr:hypothetical protein [Pyrinomonadaceae bacterium]